MIKIAITGNIASGKSTVENFLLSKKFKVLDTDEVSHNLFKKDSVKKEVASVFQGFDIFENSENSEISRPKLGKIVFSNDNLRKKLEKILHPKIKDEIGRFFRQQKKQGEKIAFVSIPLLFEAKFEKFFDKTILIYADDKIRLQRLIGRNGLLPEDAQKRLDSQIKQDEKISKVDYIIYNNTSINDLHKNINEILKLLYFHKEY
jgi:dephospho-CoA kinase